MSWVVRDKVVYDSNGYAIGKVNDDGSMVSSDAYASPLGTYSNGVANWNAANSKEATSGSPPAKLYPAPVSNTSSTPSASTTTSSTSGSAPSAWTPPETVTNPPASTSTTAKATVPMVKEDTVQRIIDEAKGYLGMQYGWGGDGSNGTIDCSGLVMQSFAAVGITLPHHAQTIYSNYGSAVTKANLQPGDLVFYDNGKNGEQVGHVAIYVGNGQVIEAGDPVKVINMNYRSDVVGYKRVVTQSGHAAPPAYTASPGVGEYAQTGAGASALYSAMSSKESINDIFQKQLGRDASSSEISMIEGGNWSADHVNRYIMSLPAWIGSNGYNSYFADANSVWRSLIGTTALPQNLVTSWAQKGYTQNQIAEAIRALPEYKTGVEVQTSKVNMMADWEAKTGRKMSDVAKAQMDTAIEQNWSAEMWDSWVKAQPEYANGIEVEGQKASVQSVLEQLWGIGAVVDKLAEDPNYIENVVYAAVGKGASQAVIEEWARSQPEYMQGPGAASDKETLRNFYATIMRAPIKEDYLDSLVRAGTTTDQLIQILRQTDEYKAYFAGKPSWMTETEFVAQKMTFNVVGADYFNNPDYQYSPEQLSFFMEHGITPSELGQRYAWTEAATAELAHDNWLGEAIGKSYTQADIYAMVSGAEGSGQMKADLLEAQNRRNFDESFKMYTGRMPTEADYQYLRDNYVSPNEYAARMHAVETAVTQFANYDKIFRRVYGFGADMTKLQDVAMGAEGSGAYQALMDAAEELDRYTLVWRQYSNGVDPTPSQYAQWAGFAGPEELQKRLNVKEWMDQQGPTIMKTWDDYWTAGGSAPMTSGQLETLLGQYQGWGALDAKLQAAKDHKAAQDQARNNWLSQGTAVAYTTITSFGGPQTPLLRAPQG